MPICVPFRGNGATMILIDEKKEPELLIDLKVVLRDNAAESGTNTLAFADR
jgi:hypothetical protein